MKNTFINEIKIGTEINDEVFAVKSVKKSVTKDGKPYADVVLSDKTGQIKAKIWSEALQACDELKEGDIVRIFGKTGSFNNQPQLIISSATTTNDFDLADFIATSIHDIAEMENQLKGYLNKIKNNYIKSLLDNIFTPDFFKIYCEAPAAYTVHHAYKGGMVEHTIDILEMAEVIADRYPKLNKDVLYAGVILHDIGKLKEYSVGTTIQMTTEGKLLGHVYLGTSFVEKNAPKNMPKELLDEILHLILSHQGLLEFGSPILPKTPEAIILAQLDDASAKLNTVYYHVQNSESEGDFTDFQRHLGTDLYKSPYHGENISK